MDWSESPPNWETPIGEKIDRFLRAVSERFPDYKDTIVVFGSATIHLRLDPAFNSADADLRGSTEAILPFKALTEEIGMGKSGKDDGHFYLDITPPSAFRSTESWFGRAHTETRHGLKIMIPQVRDALVGKLHRRRKPEIDGIEPKDLRAFVRVRELTGTNSSAPSLRPARDSRLHRPLLRVKSPLPMPAFPPCPPTFTKPFPPMPASLCAVSS